MDDTTKLYSSGDSSELTADLPQARDRHETIMINSTHIFLVGGNPEGRDKWVHIFDLEHQTYTPVGEKIDHHFHRNKAMECGAVTDGQEGSGYVVCFAGARPNVAQIFDLDTLEWSFGPLLPRGLMMDVGSVVPFEDSFVIFGGSGFGREIYQWDADSKDFVLRPETLSEGFHGARTVIPIPSSAVLC